MWALVFTPQRLSFLSCLCVCVFSWYAKSFTDQPAEQALHESCLLPGLTLAQSQSPWRETEQRRKRCFENTRLCRYMFYCYWSIHRIGNRRQVIRGYSRNINKFISRIFESLFQNVKSWTEPQCRMETGWPSGQKNGEYSVSGLPAVRLRDCEHCRFLLYERTPYIALLWRGVNKVISVTILARCRPQWAFCKHYCPCPLSYSGFPPQQTLKHRFQGLDAPEKWGSEMGIGKQPIRVWH